MHFICEIFSLQGERKLFSIFLPKILKFFPSHFVLRTIGFKFVNDMRWESSFFFFYQYTLPSTYYLVNSPYIFNDLQCHFCHRFKVHTCASLFLNILLRYIGLAVSLCNNVMHYTLE